MHFKEKEEMKNIHRTLKVLQVLSISIGSLGCIAIVINIAIPDKEFLFDKNQIENFLVLICIGVFAKFFLPKSSL